MHAREELICELRAEVADERVLAAIAAVPREAFVPPVLVERAYENCALPIGRGQTISQPLVVARMAALLALRGGELVLDVGTGSGYHAAVLAALGARVISIERDAGLSRRAGLALAAAGAADVELYVGDGSCGLVDRAPFAAINVAAAAPRDVLDDLARQLAPGGRMIAPCAGEPQRLVLLRRTRLGIRADELERVRFVPLVSAEG
jgi:protein-L-isoaspartate(D-aspartate) O-methyltransferase